MTNLHETQKLCDGCKGRKIVWDNPKQHVKQCNICKGEGYIWDEEKLKKMSQSTATNIAQKKTGLSDEYFASFESSPEDKDAIMPKSREAIKSKVKSTSKPKGRPKKVVNV